MFMTKKKHKKIIAEITHDVYMQMQKNIRLNMDLVRSGSQTVEEVFGPKGAEFTARWMLEIIGLLDD